MKKIFCVFLSVLFCVAALPVAANADNKHTNSYMRSINISTFATSLDGQYEYAINSDNGEAYFCTNTADNITVLNIPRRIDGHNVVGIYNMAVHSKCMVKVNFSESIEFLHSWAFPQCTSYETQIPLCSANTNDGLKIIERDAFCDSKVDDDTPYCVDLKLKTLILPTGLEYIGYGGIDRKCETIVFQSDPFTSELAVYTSGYSVDLNELKKFACDVYFSTNALNVEANILNFKDTFDEFGNGGKDRACPYVTIYKKPGAEGFEKFVDEGYTVKEYTDEWWRDIKEIQSVTISGAGVTEKADSRALGTVTNLGWSESNDPAQYLSHEYELSMKSGEKVTLSSAFAPADAYDDRTFFVSLNEDVAAVDMETGELTALKKGAAKIRCVAASGVYSDCLLYVDGGTFADNSNENNGENTDNQSSGGKNAADSDNQSKNSFSDKAKAALASVKTAFSSTKTTLAALPSKPWFLPTAIATATALLAAILIPIARKKKRK